MKTIWAFFIFIGIIFSIITNQIDVLNTTILSTPKKALDLLIVLVPLVSLWMGIMNIAKLSGLLDKIASLFKPLFRLILPELKNDDEAIGYISSNIIINMFGLGSAATPFGLKAMKRLQDLNENKDSASRSMITFLILNTTGLTIVPTSIISLRILHNSANPQEIMITALIATLSATFFGLILDRIIGGFYAKCSKH